jgi:hypothetical protein
MPANLVNIPQFSAPVWLLFRRIDWHVRSGGMLAGMKWNREGNLRVDGAANLPSLQPLRISVDSAIFQGALRPGENSPLRSNSPLFNTVVVQLGLAVDVRHGFVERDPEKNSSRKGLLEWAALLMDAIETDVDGVIDSRLNGSCSKPLSYQLREPDPGELSYAAVLDVVLTSDGYHRGQRSCGVQVTL